MPLPHGRLPRRPSRRLQWASSDMDALAVSGKARSRHSHGQAVRIVAPGTIAVNDVIVREPGPGEVRSRLEGCGVCGSNLPVWEGRDWFEYPLDPGAPGHEGWGVIDAVGDEVSDLEPGDRVAALSYHAFAELDVAAASSVVRLPDTLAGMPFPGEPLGCAMNVFRRSDIQPG